MLDEVNFTAGDLMTRDVAVVHSQTSLLAAVKLMVPEVFGDWNSVFRRFSRWSAKGVWWRIFEAMSDDPDFEYLIVDSTIVRAHQHAAGAKKGGLKIRPLAARAAA